MDSNPSQLLETLYRIDRANYTNLLRQKEIRRRKNKDCTIPFFPMIIAIYLKSQQISQLLIEKYSSSADRTLVYSMQRN